MSIQSVPVELLVYIFELVVPHTDDQHTQVRLSHVNSRFRQVAIATPSLWTHIVYTAADSLDASFNLAQLNISRSQDKKLRFDAYIEGEPEDTPGLMNLESLLESSRPRIESFWLTLTGYLNFHGLNQIIKDLDPSTLETLSITTEVEESDEGAAYFGPMPLLKHLTLDVTPFECDDSNTPCFPALRSLTIRRKILYADHFGALLEHAPMIEEIRFQGARIHVRFYKHRPLSKVITCPNLRRVIIRAGDRDHPDTGEYLWRCLDAPKLEEFSVEEYAEINGDWIKTIVNKVEAPRSASQSDAQYS